MAKKGSFSKVYDKNGDYVDVEAARFDGTRTFQMQGDVSATQTWNGDSASALTLNTSIGAKKVTTDKINDKAVQTGQIDDGAVGLTQIATNAMNGTVQDNDSKLATHAAVKTYVDSQISGQGTYLGKHTVAEINAMVTDNLHNGDRVMTSDSGTINLGPGGVGFDVEAGEDLILYKSGSTVQWDSMDGNFKTKQTAVSDPTASGTGLTFIDSASQDENGEMTLSKKTVQDGTTSQKGVVQLEDSHSSTSTTKAATPNSVKEAYDLANTANTGAVKNVAYDSTNKKITKTINGTTSDVVSVATLKTDMALNNVDNTSDANKPVSTAQQAALDLKLDKTGDGKDVTATFTEASTRANIGTGEKLSVIFGKIKKWFSDLGTAAFKNVPASGDASSTEVVLGSDTRLSAGASAVQDVTVDGASVVNSSTKVAAVPNASTSAKGAVQLAGSIGATVASENNKAATEKAVRDTINALDAEVTSSDGTNVQVKVTEADGKISAVNVTTDNTENKNNKVSSWQSTPDNTHYPSEKLVKVSLDGKVDIANIDLDSKTTTILAEVQALAQKGIHYARFYTRGDGGAANISDKPVSGSGFLCEVVCNRYAGTTNYRYLVTCWVGTDKNPYWTYVVSSTYLITWSRLNAYVPGTPKNNNLVAMDADGRVKDSGLTKSSVESAISSAGSAIQGVKVNNTTLTPDANKVVNIPLATTSADGAMSAADKVALEGKVTGPSSATADNIAVFDGTTGKLIKNSGKKISDLALDSNVVHVRDCVIRRDNESGSGWFKAADISFRSYGENVTGLWHFSMATIGGLQDFDLIVNVRFNESGTTPIKYAFRVEGFRNLNTSNVTFKLVTRGLSGSSSTVVELWVFLKKDWVDVSISSLRNSGLHSESNQKWNYYNGSGGGSAAPTEDSQNNVYVYDPDITISKTRQTAVTDPTASGTALSFIDSITQNENGVISATKKSVAVDSTPTASSTNLVTSGGVKTALDGKQNNLPTSGTASSTFAINIGGYARSFNRAMARREGGSTPQYAKLFTIDNYNTSEASSGVLISFSTRDQSDTNISGLIRINFQGSTAKGYVTVLSNGANPPSSSRTRFGAVLNASSKWEVWCSMETWSIISAQIISDRVSYDAHTNSTSAESPTGLTLFSDGVNLTKALNTSTTGSTSVPIYAKADGTIEACTDDFARDSEVVSSVQIETASNTTKMTYTKNGSKTDIIEFMTTAEARSVWTNAKAAVANAS